jgi:hypothetical protein
MIQLYFLSILCNSLCGYILFDGNEGESLKKNEALNNPTFQLALGIVSIATGVLKILSPTMDGLPILGDLVPAGAGIAGGLLMVFGISRQNKASPSPSSLETLGVSLLRFRKPLGLGLFASALLHFLFPKALFL